MTKIFVAKLNFKTSKAQLEKLFSEYGTVSSAKIITDRETQKSKGYGFVEMDDDNEAKRAIKALDGSEFDGRQIAVQVSENRK